MILQLLEKLNSKNIILASASPRRSEILKNIGLKFEVIPSTFKEDLDESAFQDPKNYIAATAAAKAQEVRQRLSAEGSAEPHLIIGCDTCITRGGKIYGKPKDDAHAFQMLSSWSDSSHDVVSAVCLLHRLTHDKSWQQVAFHETTSVTFSALTDDIIKPYIDTHEPRDKAGAYGIQGLGGTLVESIKGDYYNVMGFPLNHFCRRVAPLLQSHEGQTSPKLY